MLLKRKGGGGANQNFPRKEWGGLEQKGGGGGLERFRILRGGLAKKRGVTFLRRGFIPWCLLLSSILDALVSRFSNFMGSNFNSHMLPTKKRSNARSSLICPLNI